MIPYSINDDSRSQRSDGLIVSRFNDIHSIDIDLIRYDCLITDVPLFSMMIDGDGKFQFTFGFKHQLELGCDQIIDFLDDIVPH